MSSDPWWWKQAAVVAKPSSPPLETVVVIPLESGELPKRPFLSPQQFLLSHELTEEPVQLTLTGFEFLSPAPLLLPNEAEQLVVSVCLVVGDSFKTPKVTSVCSQTVVVGGGVFAKWADLLQLPYKLCDLSLDAYLEFELVGIQGVDGGLGVAKFNLFSPTTGVLRIGKQEVALVRTESGGKDMEEDVDLGNQVAFEREEANRRLTMGKGPAWLNAMAEDRVLASRRSRRRQLEQQHFTTIVGILGIELAEFGCVPVVWECNPSNPTIVTTMGGGDGDYLYRQLRRKPDNCFPEVSSIRKEEEVPNVVEEKLYLMRRTLTRRKGEDSSIVPNHREWKQIDHILSRPFIKPKNEEEDLLWMFRYSLVRDSRALTKVLNSVKWDSEEEVNQVQKLLEKWESALFSDVLRLLSGEITEHPIVRAYAVKVLANSKNQVINLYLAQLVQALRHDRVSVDKETSQGPLQRFLIQKCAEDYELASGLHWLLKVEMLLARPAKIGSQNSPFSQVFDNYTHFLQQHAYPVYERIKRQDEFVQYFTNVAEELKQNRGAMESKKARQVIGNLETFGFTIGEAVTLNGFPNGRFVGMQKKSVKILSSTTTPMVVDLLFEEEDPTIRTVRLMFKVGDDMRQDQLVLQLINLMNSLFKKNGLDLEMTVYRVLATGTNRGIIEFVSNAVPLSTVNREYKSISNFLSQCNGPALYPSVLDKFIRSCAGYSIVTYVLGIGDRHLDNILILPTGKMFHIDFGYSFGRDKSLATPMRLTADMLDTMGREGEVKFRTLCWEAFKTLRQEAELILSVVGLMSDAGIPDLLQTPVALAGIQDRLKLTLGDEEAERSLNATITQSVNALGQKFIEIMHEGKQWLG
ncbi:hypothetical protein BASA81_006503 [Batrachochytrium salamandrivorans]|nr:hypothetical protein BASA81_006503 [Batrachochytrium salamandrivorans]